MPSADYDATPREIRSFAKLQVALTTIFFAVLFWMFGGTDADFPPVWMTAGLLILVLVGTVLSERVWLSATPLSPEDDPRENRIAAVGIYAGQTVRKVFYCSFPLIIAVIACFLSTYGGWPLLIAGVPGLVLLAWEAWPSLRNTSMTAAMLDARGAESKLVESFLDS